MLIMPRPGYVPKTRHVQSSNCFKIIGATRGGGQIDFCPLPWQIAPPPPYLT